MKQGLERFFAGSSNLSAWKTAEMNEYKWDILKSNGGHGWNDDAWSKISKCYENRTISLVTPEEIIC